MALGIGAEFFVKFQTISRLRINVDGKVAFIKTVADVAEDCYKSDIFLLDDNGRERRLTFTDGVSDFTWTDPNHILFASVPGGRDGGFVSKGYPLSVYHSMDIRTGGISEALRIHKKVIELLPESDGSYLFTARNDPREDDWLKRADGDPERFLRLREAEGSVWEAEEIPFWSNGKGITAGIRTSLYQMDSGAITRLTPPAMDVWNLRIGDGFAIFIGQDFNFGDVKRFANSLFILDLKDHSIRRITDCESFQHGENFKEENKIFAEFHYQNAMVSGKHVITVRTDGKLHGVYQDARIDRINLETGVINTINADAALCIFNSLVSDITFDPGRFIDPVLYNEGVFYIGTQEDCCPVFYSDFSKGTIEAVTTDGFSATDIALHDGTLYAVGMCGLSGMEIYSLSPPDFQKNRITMLNERVFSNVRPSVPEAVSCGGDTDSRGWVLRPAAFREGEKYPAVLSIHGGPNMAYGTNFVHELQFLSGLGYGVLYCNPRGSVGRGGAFADIRGKYGDTDYEDIMDFCRRALDENPWIDQHRLGVMGGSYGGYMTSWIVGHTDLFKAAVAERFDSNLIAQFLLSEIGIEWMYDTFHTTPWDGMEKLWDASPLKYANKVTTPVLMIQAAEDYTCNLEGALQYFTALKYLGIETRLVVFGEADHSLKLKGLPSWRVRRLREIQMWFDKYLKV